MELAALQCRHLTNLAEAALATLEEEDRAREPVPGTKTAGWLVGHLVITGDFARRLAGRPPIAPKSWRELFSPGTRPSADATVYPPMAELSRTMLAIYRDLAEHLASMPSELRNVVNPYEPARASFPTAGDFVAYIASGHFGYHLGQLAIWRAAARPVAA
ncbi:MAG: DinB family protein [Gemmatimonadales bacterium]